MKDFGIDNRVPSDTFVWLQCTSMADWLTPHQLGSSTHHQPEATFTKFTVDYPMTNTIPDLAPLRPEERVAFKVGTTETRREVRREDDIMTPQQVKYHRPQALATMKK